VCYDSRNEGSWDLADKELAKLIAEVSEKNPHIAVIMDCCHSGSGTRGDLDSEMAVRRAPIDQRQRPLESFIFSPAEVEQLSAFQNPIENPSGWTLPKGRYVFLSACRDVEEAREYSTDGQRRGTFSYFLLDALNKANGSLTYRDLFKRTNALVRSKATAQSPQLEATVSSDLDQPFLGGAIAPRTPYFTVSLHRDYGWVIDGGAVHGVPQPAAGQTTVLALFSFDTSSEQLRQPSAAVGEAEVLEVMPQLSKINLKGVANPHPEMTFKAIVTSLPLPPMGVWLEGETAGVELVRQAIATGNDEQPSLYVREVARTESAEFRLLAKGNQYLITRPVDDRPLVGQIDGYNIASATQAVQRLEHIARWTKIAELASPATSRIRPDAVEMQVYQAGQELTEPQIRLEYRQEGNKQKQPTFQIKLTNTSDEPLYCALLNLTERYAVSAALIETGGIWLKPREEAWVAGGKLLYAFIDPELWKRGATETKDIYKLIVSTAEFDATLLEQDNLDLPRGTRAIVDGRKSTLNRLMREVQSRDVSLRAEDEEYDDWVTSQMTITTVRPREITAVPNDGQSVLLGAGVRLQPHPSLQANVRLSTVNQATRDLGSHILPPILQQDDPLVQPFQFTATRGTDPGLSALELSQVADISVVTPQTPLKLTVDMPLEPGEHLLPISYDGEFFLPLGRGKTTQSGETEIVLERLPEPISEGQRSLGGSIRIFFQKVVSQKLGLEFPYPLLAAAEFNPDGTTRYEVQLDKVKERVAQAQRVVLYIHGIIGDTFSMVPSLQQAKIELDGQQRTLASLYDVVLAFDYENINTSIEENARLLKQRLNAVGLGAGHGKTLHIVAHSMGGLVSRWFIEREGGNQIVNHLIMLGTPNAGSPWPTVQQWATAALAIGLNSLSTVALPVKVLGTLLSAIETIDIALDQMQPNSEFLRSLRESEDPKIPYTILAGNTSIIPAALHPQGQEPPVLERLLKKLFNTVVDLPFFGQPNDIAVTVHSIKSVPHGRSPEPQIQEVACDHLIYFIHPTGLEALATALIHAQQQVARPVPAPVLVVNSTGQRQEELPQKAAKPRWLAGFIVGLVVAILATVGFALWQKSQQPEPNQQKKMSQSLPAIIHKPL
jgi:pimeloyl-ACP methyl ester carboxylesterase